MNTPGIVDSIIQKLFVQFRFNFEYLGLIESDPLCPYNFLQESKKAGKKNLDGSEVAVLEDGNDPFSLDRICHLNSFFAFGHPMKAYKFRDDGYEALNHVTYENFVSMYGICLFDLMDRKEAAPLIFPTDYNFYEESLTKQFLISKKYENGYILPVYHRLHNEVFSEKYFEAMDYNPKLLDLRYNVSDYPTELKESIVIINFGLTMLFNVILVESACVELFGYKNIERKINLTVEDDKMILLLFLLSCLHPFAYAVCYGIFRDRYAMRNNLPVITPHGSFYFGTDAERKPFKEALQGAIKKLINFKYQNNSLTKDEKEALLLLSNYFGIGYSTNLEMYEKNKHFWSKVDYCPQGIQDESFIAGANESSPLWRMWYWWWGAYWSYPDLIEICRNNREVLGKQLDKKISREASELKLNFIFESSRLMKNYLSKKVNEPEMSEPKRNLLKKNLKKIWNISQ